MAFVSPVKMWEKGLCAMHDAPEVDVHHPFEVADRLLGGSGGEIDAGIVDDHVDRAVQVGDRVGPGEYFGTISNVNRGGSDLDPVALTHANGFGKPNRIEVGKREMSAA